MNIDRQSWNLGQIEAYCYMVKRGKLAAWLEVPNNELKVAISTVESEGLKHLTEEVDSNWCGLWIWQKGLAGELIQALPLVSVHLPSTVYQWFLGSLFGYTVESIETHLRELSDENPVNTRLVTLTARR